ncbi:MAG: hypothetical protein ACFCUO_02440, partial [Rhodospirillales bacterium]
MNGHIKIGDIAPRIQHTATGTQTHFDFPFPIFQAADLEVHLDDVEQATGYVVHGAGNSTGGTLTFDTPPAAGSRVTLRRVVAIERTRDFLRTSPLTADDINDDLDYLTATVQQVGDNVRRAVRLGATDENADLTLPPRAERADKVLAFDADGNVTARAAAAGDGVTDHGGLAGLGDDDHPQYLNAARAEGWLSTKTLDDIAAGDVSRRFGADAEAKLAGIEAGAQVNTVASVFGRAGSVTAAAGDYAASQVDNDSGTPGETVGEALGRLQADKAAAADLAAHAADAANPHAVGKAQVGLGNVPDLKVRLDAATDPGPADDAAAAWAVGSRWVNVVTDGEFVCVDASAGAAVWKPTTAAGGGTSDHGALAGLGDDDHPQYLDAARADQWLAAKTSDDLAEGAANRYMALAGSGTAATAARSDHDHAGTYAAAGHGHAGLVPAGGSAGQVLAKASGASLDVAWRDQPPPGEINTASNVNVGGIGVFRRKSGTNLEFRGIGAGSSRISTSLNDATNEIRLDVSEPNLNLANIGGSLGSNAAHGVRGGGGLHATATNATAGFMSPGDKAKLDGIAPGAEVNTVASVFGRGGAVVTATGDYVASQVTNDAGVAGATVADALAALHADKARAADLAAHAASTANPHAVGKAQVGLGNVPNLKVRLDAATDPGAADGAAAGWAVGSRWVNVAADREFVCVDATAGAAVWKETTAAGGTGAVASVFGRSGAVAAAVGDYRASQVANDSGVAGTTVRDALHKLDNDIQALAPDTNRAIVAPASDDRTVSLELPAAVDRRDFLLGFTATGAVTTTKVATAALVDGLAATGVRAVASMAALRTTLPPVGSGAVWLAGYYDARDGGEGMFQWDAAATVADNGGTVVAPDPATPGRWIRAAAAEEIDVRWFGVRGDGVTDNAPHARAKDYDATDTLIALRNHLTADRSKHYTVYFPPGHYKYTNNRWLLGVGSVTIQATGAKFQNITTSGWEADGRLFNNQMAWDDQGDQRMLGNRPFYDGFRFADADSGETVLTMETPGDEANFSVG